jgi:ech hydrogenase subunit F
MICQKRCPSQAIEIERGTRWTVDRFRCVICGQCADLCRFGALSVSPEYAKSATPAERLASGREVYAITYVKPERPKKDAGE